MLWLLLYKLYVVIVAVEGIRCGCCCRSYMLWLLLLKVYVVIVAVEGICCGCCC